MRQQDQMTFQNENLAVDYITFTYPQLENYIQDKLAKYLHGFNFNSKFGTQEHFDTLYYQEHCRFQVYFIRDTRYNDGTQLCVPGESLQPYQGCTH